MPSRRDWSEYQAGGYWCIAIELPSISGERRRKVVRSKSKSAVREKARAFRRELDAYGDLPTSYPTVKTWLTFWLAQHVVTRLRPKTAASYATAVTKHLIPVLGEKTRINKITPDHVHRLHRHFTESGLSSTYARNVHHYGAKAFDVAVREGKLSSNPFRKVDPPLKDVADLDIPTIEETISLLEYLSTHPDGVQRTVSILTGARRAEVLGLETDRVTDILDLSWQLQRIPRYDDGTPIVPVSFEYRHLEGGLYLTRPKSRAGWRIIPLVEPLKSVLERYIAQTPPNPYGLVFTTPEGRPKDPDADTAAWRNLADDYFGEDRNVRLHDLRHVTADILFLAGVEEDVIMEILGHSTRAMSRGYKSKGNIVRLRASMERAYAALTQQSEDRPAEAS